MSKLINKRYQFIRALNTDRLRQTYLVGDTQVAGHPLRAIKQYKLLISNPRTEKVSRMLCRKQAELLKNLGERPHISQVLDSFEDYQHFYLVEEFIVGRSLAEQLVSEQTLSESQTILLLTEIFKILESIHHYGVIHRAVKPSNLIRRQSDDRLVLINFGIFKEISQTLARTTEEKTILDSSLHSKAATNGSVAHFSEEREGDGATFDADLYAVGLIGIQAIAGLSAVEQSLVDSKSTPLKALTDWHERAQASPELIQILDKIVEPDRSKRYQSATEVLAALAGLNSTQVSPPILMRPSSLLEKEVPKVAEVTFSSPSLQPQTPNRRLWVYRWAGTAILAIAVTAVAAIYSQFPQKFISNYLLDRGANREQQGEDRQAVSYYTQAIDYQPSNAEAYSNRALAQLRLGNREAALEDLTQAIQLQPSAEVYYYRGNLLLAQGDRTGAIEDYTKAIELQPDYAPAYVNRGSVKADSGDEKGAIEDYTKAIELDESLAAAWLNRCLSRSNLGDQLGAIADCSQAIALRPTHTMAYQNRGLARRRNEDIRGAIEDYNTAIRLDPEDADPYYNRALIRKDLGDNAGAIADFTEAIARNPNHVLAYYDRGLTYIRQENFQAARADLQQSAQLCLDLGRPGCHKDAQYQLSQLPQ